MDRNRFKVVAFKVGDGDKSNFIDLALKIESHHGKPRYLCTDKYSVYGTYALGKKRVRSKSETCLVESFNSSMRDMLARLNRRTKRFSKSIEMIRLTLNMFFHKEIAYKIYDC